jgi:hypothetical protein
MRSLKSFRKIRIWLNDILGGILVIVRVEAKSRIPKHVSPFR